MATPIIHFDYEFSPYGQKTKLVLEAAGIPYLRSDQPIVLPRPDLEALGITYRRIPLLAIGKDVYADSAKVLDAILAQPGAHQSLSTNPVVDRAYQAWGDAVFQEALAVVPSKLLTPAFVQDRQTVFPVLARPDIATLRPSALAAFTARLRQVEDEFLSSTAGGPFIHGEKISLADIHVAWPLRWALKELVVPGEDPDLGPKTFPKVWRLFESLPTLEGKTVEAAEVRKTILESTGAPAGPTGVQDGDAFGIKAGTAVTVESFDSEPGKHPQAGKLIATAPDEVVIELENGIRLHFPRIGYIVRPQ